MSFMEKQSIDGPEDSEEIRRRKHEAFLRLEQLIRPIPDLDEKKELEEYWDKKYEEYLNLR